MEDRTGLRGLAVICEHSPVFFKEHRNSRTARCRRLITSHDSALVTSEDSMKQLFAVKSSVFLHGVSALAGELHCTAACCSAVMSRREKSRAARLAAPEQ